MPKLTEIKARCSNPQQIDALLQKAGAVFKGIDHQIDTYFMTERGRLKLREGNIENTLIHYIRPNQAGPKNSTVTLYKPQDATALKAVLSQAYDIKVVVDKKRGIYFIDNVKFHVDEVKGLGSFVEIEAIDEAETMDAAVLLEQCKYYMDLLDIQTEDLLEVSYSDMLLANSKKEKSLSSNNQSMIKVTPRIERLKEKKLIGYNLKMSLTNNKTGQLWGRFGPKIKEIKNRVTEDKISMQIYDPSYYQNFNSENEFEKWATVEVIDFNNIPNEMKSFTLQEGLYAVFDYKGSSSDDSIFQYIFWEWLPNSPYQIDDRPHFEVLGKNYKNNDSNSEEEIWIPSD